MSVYIKAKNGNEEVTLHLSNGEWAAATAAANVFDSKFPRWTGVEEHEYTREELATMADRMKQLAHLEEALCALANNGGARTE